MYIHDFTVWHSYKRILWASLVVPDSSKTNGGDEGILSWIDINKPDAFAIFALDFKFGGFDVRFGGADDDSLNNEEFLYIYTGNLS